MVAHSKAAPPTYKSKSTPKIHQTAYVHSLANVIGDIEVGANVTIAPGTSIRADEGSPFYIGEGSNIQDGVVIRGLEQGRVIGDNQNHYGVWIGKNSSITHMALIHGPAYIGDDCFIGFRSTVFNARVGNGCIVMMHALIQDVEIAPGKYVRSGAVITNQQQADSLPNVQKVDQEIARHLVGMNDASFSGYMYADASMTERQNRHASSYTGNQSNGSKVNGGTVRSDRLSTDTIEQVRNLLIQGYKIGTEHVDQRRFRTGSWQSCSPIDTRSESEAIAALEQCIANHSGEYVRLFGIDPKAKRRVMETIIQRPDDPAPRVSNTTNSYAAASSYTPASSYAPARNHSNATNGLNADVVEQVRNLLAAGYKIGIEHVDQRRFRTGSWASCEAIDSRQESAVLAAIEANLAEYAGEYVRIIGIDPKAKRRVLETIIQRPEDQSNPAPREPVSYNTTYTSTPRNSAVRSNKISPETVEQVRNLIASGYRIGTEHVDQRRFRTGSWASCSPITAKHESEAIAALEECLSNHAGEYVRLFGIEPKAKRRVMETIIQRPDN